MIKLEDIQQVLKEQKVDATTINKVIEKLREAEEEKKADKEPKNKQKSQFVLLAFDKQGVLKGQTLTGAVLQIEDGIQPALVIDRLKAAANQYNNTKKGRRLPVKTISETLNIPRKFSRQERVLIKTKEPILLISTDNAI